MFQHELSVTCQLFNNQCQVLRFSVKEKKVLSTSKIKILHLIIFRLAVVHSFSVTEVRIQTLEPKIYSKVVTEPNGCSLVIQRRIQFIYQKPERSIDIKPFPQYSVLLHFLIFLIHIFSQSVELKFHFIYGLSNRLVIILK